jgi:hypothetical protein
VFSEKDVDMKEYSKAKHKGKTKRLGHIEQLQSEIELRKHEEQTLSNNGSALEDWSEAESEVLEPEQETENS